MTARSVYWQDGMFMWPHHMQQEEHFQRERLQINHRWDVHHNWGLRRLEFDADAFKSGRLVIRVLQARLRDGTLVDVPDEGRLPFLDLNEMLLGKDQVTILLAVAKVHANRPNAAARGGAGTPDGTVPVDTRYLVEEFEVEDENTGEEQQTLQFRILNLKLLPDYQDVAGYEVLPIGRFEKSTSAEGGPQLDISYIPPLLACDAWKPLAVNILQAAFHHLSSRMEDLAEKVRTRGITFETHNPGDNVLLGQLAVLNEASCVFNTIAFAEGMHPFPVYLEMCRLVGQLAIFSGDNRAPKLLRSESNEGEAQRSALLAYDHDDLGRCFYSVKRLLEEIEPPKDAYEHRAFIGEVLRMQVAMEPKWLEAAWQMFVGVQSSLPEADVIKLLTKAGHLDMKIGSGDKVDHIFEKGLKGLEFTHTPQPPRLLPVTKGLTYFQINRDAQKTEWAQVHQSKTLAIRVNQNRLALNPQGNIQGQRIFALKQQAAQTATDIQFSLYLVPS